MENRGKQMNTQIPTLFFISFLLCSTLLDSTLTATELIPFIKNDRLGVIINELKYPENLSKDLVSGLSNKILIRFELMFDSQVQNQSKSQNHNPYQSQREVTITTKYDLWEENFKINILVSDSDSTFKTLPSLKDVLSFLAHLKISNLWPLSELSQSDSFNLKVDTLFNPIEKEQMEKIKKWVIQNSTSLPIDPTGFGSINSISSSLRTHSLFNKIFEQYSTGTPIASVGRETLISKLIHLTEVPHEK